jgi:cholesterol transport system auxiliary component
LVVALPRAQPGFDTQLIAYTETPLAIDYYTKSEWVDSPAMMLAPLVEDAIADTGAFQAVVIPPSPSPGDVRLEIDIIRLQQEFMTTPSQVRLTLRAKLFDVRTGDVLGTQLFEAVEYAPSEDAYGGVQAANLGLKRILEQLTDFVVSNAPRKGGRRS